MLLAAALAGQADAQSLAQVAGPVQIGPSSGDGDAPNHRATLTTRIVNQGRLPDRLINVGCPGFGSANLLGGQMRQVGAAQQNGLDLPASAGGTATPIAARIALTDATQPLTDGVLVPCALYFQHAGQRIVVFTLGAHETAADEP